MIKDWLKRLIAFSYFNFLSFLKKDITIVVSHIAIGDTCYALSSCSFLEKRGRCHYILCSLRKELIEKSYPQIKSVTWYHRFSLKEKIILTIFANPELCRYFKNKNIFFVYPTAYYNIKREQVKKSFIDIIKEDILITKEEYIITYPQYPRTSVTSIDNWEQIKHKVVVCNPYSNSMSFGNSQLWKDVVKLLKKNGYIVFTNVIAEQEVIEGTLPLKCGIYEFASIAQEIPLIISTRSGLLDFLSATTCKKIVVYNSSLDGVKDDVFYNIYTMSAWGKDNITELMTLNVSQIQQFL